MPRLYEDDDVYVDLAPAPGGQVTVVFSSWTKKPERSPLWKPQVARAARAGLFVVAKHNHWYQIENADAVMAAVRGAAADFDGVSTAGSSMGGYAALRFASRIGADFVVAVSPQYSVDPRRVGDFESRWNAESAQIRHWQSDLDAGHVADQSFVVCDLRCRPDAAHAALIAERTGAAILDFPYSGHPSGEAIADLGLLNALVRARNEAELHRVRDAYLFGLNSCATAWLNRLRLTNRKYRAGLARELADRRPSVTGAAHRLQALDAYVAQTLAEA